MPFAVYQPIQCKIIPRKRAKTSVPHKKLRDGTSENWSGYAAATSLIKPAMFSVTQISGTWTVPEVKASKEDTYSSIWVGIDGFSSGTVEQIGTEHDWHNGKQEHYAWFEMFPKYPHELSGFPVEPGDVISADITYKGNGTFKLVLSNHTKQVTTTVPHSHTVNARAQRSSAEWIVEAPATSSGVLPLAHLSQVKMKDCTATINGVTGSIDNGHWKSTKLDMESKNGTKKARTSNLSSDSKSFLVKWKHQ